MEKIKNNIKEQGSSGEKDILAKTKIEIAELRNKDLQARAEGQNNYIPNLINSNPDVITEEDAQMWQKINNLKTIEEYNKLLNLFRIERSKIFSQEIEKKSDLFSRQEFWAFMANQMMGRFNKIDSIEQVREISKNLQIEQAREVLKNLQKIALENKDSEEAKNPNLKFIDPLLISEQEAILLNKAQKIKTMEDYEKFREEYHSIPFPEDTNKHSSNFMQFVANRVGGKLAEILKKEKES